jgi:hypothetical protein
MNGLFWNWLVDDQGINNQFLDQVSYIGDMRKLVIRSWYGGVY